MADRPAPAPEDFDAFQTYEVEQRGENLCYIGEPLVPRDEVIREVWPVFREAGYEVSLEYSDGEFMLVADPIDRGGIPTANAVLFALTIVTTLWAGAIWFHVRDPFSTAIIQGLPFAIGVLAVLGTHEFGHYIASRYYGVDATLPYFIPMVPPFGTMGAVIRIKGQIPSRKALFDIGAAGPIAGLIMTVIVTAIGFALPPVHVPDWVLSGPSIEVHFGYPLLLRAIAVAVGERGVIYQDPVAVLLFQEGIGYSGKQVAMNPVVLAGWLGMFVTFLNLIPVGQLDGGHIVRALVGPRQETFAAFVPGVLFLLAAYISLNGGNGSIWLFWGLLSAVFAYMGAATPITDERLDAHRKAVGILTLVVGLLCFTPVPISLG
ncbi:MAG: site-2 protease family protein [Halobacteriaceae archaeon]